MVTKHQPLRVTEQHQMGNHDERSALILYGSESGNALDFARELGRMTERLRFWTHITSLDAVDLSLLSEYSIAIIVTSTTGQGDLPLNARQFWKSLLRRKLPPTYLDNVRFTTFGLGDTSYPKYNWAVRKLQKRISQLGADEFYPRGEADEQHEEGLDAAFVPWMTDLRRYLFETFLLANGLLPIPEEVPIAPKWILALEEESSANRGKAFTNPQARPPPIRQPNDCNKLYGRDRNERFNVVLQENRRMTPASHFQDVRHLVFTSSHAAAYDPGDILTISPKNSSEDVQRLIILMNWTDIADQAICFVPNDVQERPERYPPPPIVLEPTPSPKTLRRLLTNNLDLNAIPRRSFFSMIAYFTDDQMQKERLLEFVKPEYLDELYDYTSRPRRSILEVLQEFDTVKIPWQSAADVLPELRGRQFSIASGGQLKFDVQGHARFELLVAIVRYKTVIKKIREGVCTRYLAALPQGSSLEVTLQKGSLNVTQAQASRPLVLIGPGTGIAPIRSLIWERLQMAQNLRTYSEGLSNGTTSKECRLGEMALFFGCRTKNADYFYQSEWEQLQTDLPLHVFTAFSRDEKDKVYVQDIIKQQSELVFRLLHDSHGIVYVCGSSGKMPKAVRIALTEAFARYGNMRQGDADSYLQAMEKEGRYKQETW